MKNKSVIYVNYSPYENQGKILEFLLENYKKVFLFSIGHHNIGSAGKKNKLSIFYDKEVQDEVLLYHLPSPPRLVFLILPFRSLINFFQIIWLSNKIKNEYGKANIFFTVNGYVAWIGLILKKLGLVEKTSYWVCDYYPIKHNNKVIQAMRWLYWQFEKRTTKSDILSFHNKRLLKVWEDKGVVLKGTRYSLVPIGTSKTNLVGDKAKGDVKLCFLGVLKKSQGLDYIFDSAKALYKSYPNLVVEIIGPGPDEKYFKKRSKETDLKFNFHGYLSEEDIERVILQSTISVANIAPSPQPISKTLNFRLDFL